MPRDTAGAPVAETVTQPKFAVLLGRGARGKSTMAIWMAERAILASRSVIIADIDAATATLPAFFTDVHRPRHTDNAAVKSWLNQMFDDQIASQASVILDTAGGDSLFPGYAQYMDLDRTLVEKAGITPVAIHVIGPSTDDLAMLRDCGKLYGFQPERTIAVLNLGCLEDSKVAEKRFEDVRKHKIYQTAIGSGVLEVVMPNLNLAARIAAKRMLFVSAATTPVWEEVDDPDTGEKIKKQVFGFMDRHLISQWLKEMERSFAPVADWLP